MDKSHIFIVRISAARQPQHDCHATVRAVENAEETVVRTAGELSTSMLSALISADSKPACATAPASAVAAPGFAPNPGFDRVQTGLAASFLLVAAVFWRVSPELASNNADVAGLLLAATGLLSGFLSGLLGIGGSLVVVPAMYLLLPLLGVPADQVPHVAVESALLAMIPTSLAATWAQHRRGGLETGWLAKLAPGMLAGAAIGAILSMQLRGPALSLLFATQSFYYGWLLMRRAPRLADGGGPRALEWCANAPNWLAGPVIAMFCACAGMGGGPLTVPYLLNRSVPLLRAAATSGALNLCIALGGAVGLSALLGSARPTPLSFSLLGAVVVGASAVLSARHGVALAHRLPIALFRKVLGMVTLLAAAVLTLRTVWVCGW